MTTLQTGQSALPPRFRDILGFHTQDARVGLRNLAERVARESGWPGLSTTITSPPYHDLKDYDVKGQIGSGQTYTEYLDDLTDIFKLVYSLTSENGSLWIVCNSITEDGEVKLLPFDLAERLKSVGWKLKEVVIWEKDKNLPWSSGRLRNVFEYVLLFAKNHLELRTYAIRDSKTDNFRSWWIRYPERYSPKGVAPTDVWKIGIPVQGSWRHSRPNHYHLCPFPVELVRRMLLLTTQPKDSVVLDPFAGSGVVLATAECMGREYIGFEVKRDYVRNFHRTLRREVRSELRRRVTNTSPRFESDIRNLRLIKLPRMLVKSMGHRAMSNTLFTVAIERPLSPSAPDYKVAAEDILLIVGRGFSKRRRSLMERKAGKLLGKRPLSKYGVETCLKVATIGELRTLLKTEKRTMYVYTGNSISYNWKIRTMELLSSGTPLRKDGNPTYPVVVSTVRVRSI